MNPSSDRERHRNIGLKELLPYMRRFPATAWVSLLHRASGVLMALLLPLIIWAFNASVESAESYEQLTAVFSSGWGIFPGWFIKVVTLALLWAFVHHVLAGLRFLLLDVNHAAVERGRSARSAKWVLISSAVVTALLAARLLSLY